MSDNDEFLLRMEDLVNNPTPRVPVCLCLDVSGSMDGKPIKELNEGIKMFYEAIKADEMAFYSAEISIIIFGGRQPECVRDFDVLERNGEPPVLEAWGGTPMGEAINLSLDNLERRKNEYKSKGVDYYQPWLVIMADGAPNGNPSELSRAIERTQELLNTKKLTTFSIGIGSDADMKVMSEFANDRKAHKLQGLKFNEFFKWLSMSVSQTSMSMPGENIELDLEGIKGWDEL